jgi:hypothetical protein
LEQVGEALFSRERDYVRGERAAFARRVLAPAYLGTLLNMPPDVVYPHLSEEMDGASSPGTGGVDFLTLASEITLGLSELYLLALHTRGGDQVDDQVQPVQLPPDAVYPPLQEHDFQSDVPIVGPLIRSFRRLVYGLAARWGVLAVIQQQNQVNQLVAQHLTRLGQRMDELDARLVDQDRDLAHLARAVAEVGIRQRYLAKTVSPTNLAHQDVASSGASEA